MRSDLLTPMLLPMPFRLFVPSLVASVPRTLMISLDFLRLDSPDSGINIFPALDNGSMSIPSGIFSAQELIEDENGDLVPGSRPIGTNKVGMVSWLVNMKTPEYPEGREVIFVANDVTVQSGSFGADEDEHYLKASKLARASGLLRM